jgi:hypothetical protein
MDMNPLEKKTAAQTSPRAYRTLALTSFLLLGTCLTTADLGMSKLLLAQAPNPIDQAPAGWSLAGSNPTSYRTGVDKATAYEGRPSAYLQSNAPAVDGFGTMMQSIDAAAYAGKRVRLRASVESQDVSSWAGMWMRVDKQQTAVAFDNMQDRAITGTHPWNTYDVVLDVPRDATSISFGVLLTGGGKVWVNHVTLEPVGNEIKVTAPAPSQKPLFKTPSNLNFNE